MSLRGEGGTRWSGGGDGGGFGGEIVVALVRLLNS